MWEDLKRNRVQLVRDRRVQWRAFVDTGFNTVAFLGRLVGVNV